MPHNKKHHYVPRFYLKRFSKNGKSICLYNLRKSLFIASANLKNQCYKDYFYGKEESTENSLSLIEGHTAKIFKILDKTLTLPKPISPPHVTLVTYILAQYGRTKYRADALNEMSDKMFKHTYKEKLEAEFEGIDLDSFTVGIENVTLHALSSATQYFPMLLDLDYKIISNRSGVEFVTSDNPVVLYNLLLSYRKFGSNTGLAVKGLLVFFPISPDKLLIFYDSGAYRVGSDRKIKIEITNPKDAYNLNSLQACACYENIYFRDASLDVTALHKKVKPFLRSQMSGIMVFPQPDKGDEKSEIVMNYYEDIHMNFTLSFLTLRNNAKKWLAALRKQKNQPAHIARNKDLEEHVDEFHQRVDKGEYKPSEFMDYLYDKYGDET